MLKKIIVLFILLIVSITMFTYYFKKEVKEQKVNKILDQVIITLDNQLETHHMDDLKMALVLAKNEGLVNALENDDEDLGYNILSKITKEVEGNTNKRLRVQIITKELNIFCRSWDDIYAGMPIGESRQDLKYFKTHKTPRTSMEIGRRLGLKATVPVYKNGELLGYLEVISFFQSITEFFSMIGVDLYVLLDDSFSQSAVLMMDNLTIQKYIVANRNYNYNHIQTLSKVDTSELELNGVVHKDKKYIFHHEMKDGDSKVIGAFIFVIPQKYLNYFRKPEDDISFLINMTRSNLYDIVKEEKHEKKIYERYSANSLVYLQDVIDKEDRQVFFDEAYEKFDMYSKDELINILLDRDIVKKIDGEIR